MRRRHSSGSRQIHWQTAVLSPWSANARRMAMNLQKKVGHKKHRHRDANKRQTPAHRLGRLSFVEGFSKEEKTFWFFAVNQRQMQQHKEHFLLSLFSWPLLFQNHIEPLVVLLYPDTSKECDLA
nr:hypothetical protein [Pandoravirus massiliensis]